MAGQLDSNYLLAALSEGARARVMRAGHVDRYEAGRDIFTLGQAANGLVFPLSGLVSLTITTSEGQTIEVAITGTQGFVGVSQYLGRKTADTNAVVQIPGELFGVPIGPIRDLAASESRFRDAINRFLNGLIIETAQGAACNQVHSLEQRAARWLLYSSDRAGTQELHLTHDFLSRMLAVRRPSVTTVMGIFNRAGLTLAKRGRITIVDRDGLRALACNCYEVVRAATPNGES